MINYVQQKILRKVVIKVNLLEKAITIATKAHEGQVDKGGNQYILHPLAVMMKCNEYDEKIVAVLHDVIEDTNVTVEELIKEGFSEKIIEAILSLTRKEDESYVDFIKRCKQNPIGKIVKIADIDSNMDISRIPNPTEEDIERVEKYRKAKDKLYSL